MQKETIYTRQQSENLSKSLAMQKYMCEIFTRKLADKREFIHNTFIRLMHT